MSKLSFHAVEMTRTTCLQRLDALQHLLTGLRQSADSATLLTQIMEQAVKSIAAAGAGDIFLWDAPTQCLIPRAWYNLGDWVQQVRLRLGEGVAGTAAQRREGVVVNDYAHSPFASGQFTRMTHTAVMAAPILWQETLLGAITVGNEGTGQPFTPEDLQLLTLFAVFTAVALGLRSADSPTTSLQGNPSSA